MADTKIGEITHFFDKISVAIIKLEKPLKKGETIKIGEVEQTVDSMQVDRADIAKVREGDDVYKAE
jgi:hypothetical protein